MDTPKTTHEAARAGWRIQVICGCSRTGCVTPERLLAARDRPVLDVKFRCPRDGCTYGQSSYMVPPDYEPPFDYSSLPLRRVPMKKPRGDKTDAMLAGIADMARRRDQP